jgi:hypothetical protein
VPRPLTKIFSHMPTCVESKSLESMSDDSGEGDDAAKDSGPRIFARENSGVLFRELHSDNRGRPGPSCPSFFRGEIVFCTRMKNSIRSACAGSGLAQNGDRAPQWVPRGSKNRPTA